MTGKNPDFGKQIEDAIKDAVKDHLSEKLRTIRHPETGEFPIVSITGETLEDMKFVIEGSPRLLEVVAEQLGEASVEKDIQAETKSPALVFLSHASEDKQIAREIALGLTKRGIAVWFDEWEIRAGDSIARKIDDGLTDCTHFVVLLTQVSLGKEWVRTELDAGIVLKIQNQAKLIPLRHKISVDQLPKLLQPLLSPEISCDDIDVIVRDLANDIHDLPKKPSLGARPVPLPSTGHSAHATLIIKALVERTKYALKYDGSLSKDEIASLLDASVDDVDDALYELGSYVEVRHGHVYPMAGLFAKFDEHFMPWKPSEDAVVIAAHLVNGKQDFLDPEELSKFLGWDQRRMNSALVWLVERGLVRDMQVIGGGGWYVPRIGKTDGTRRFVKTHS